MNDYNKYKLSEDDYFSSFNVENDNLNEQKFGKINKKIDIYIKGNESGEPHIHLCSENREDVVRVKLKENKYQRDAYETGNKKLALSASERKALEKYMRQVESGNKITNWEVLCNAWNVINHQNPNKIDTTKIKQPSYLNIYES